MASRKDLKYFESRFINETGWQEFYSETQLNFVCFNQQLIYVKNINKQGCNLFLESPKTMQFSHLCTITVIYKEKNEEQLVRMQLHDMSKSSPSTVT